VWQLRLSSASAGFLFGLLFDPEDGCDRFLRNVGLSELHGVTSQKTVLFMLAFDDTKPEILCYSDEFPDSAVSIVCEVSTHELKVKGPGTKPSRLETKYHVQMLEALTMKITVI
jgi:hypothetical protein